VPLDPDAQQLLDMMKTMMPQSLSEMGVEGARAMMAAAPRLDGEPVHAVEDRRVPGPAGDIPVRVYKPSDRAALPVLIWLHGGGFAIGDIESYDNLCRELCNAVGAIVVSVEYRLAPEHRFPVPGEDCYAAASWVVDNASELGGDPARVAIGGDSAGGTLAIATCLMARDRGGPSFCYQALIYPTGRLRVSNLEHGAMAILTASDCEYFWQNYVGSDQDRLSPYCAPLQADDLSGLPPAFVGTAEYDATRDDAEEIAARLGASGVRATVKRYPGVFHGFFSSTAVLARAREAMAEVSGVLRAELRVDAPVLSARP
jgi:acetyl esterase